MRKLFVAVGIVCLFAACNNEPMNEEVKNPLIGTWEDTWESKDGDPCFDRFIFSDNDVTRTLQDFGYNTTNSGTIKEPYNENLHGTYQHDSSSITFNFEGYDSWNVDYSLKGNELSLTIRENKYTYKKTN